MKYYFQDYLPFTWERFSFILSVSEIITPSERVKNEFVSSGGPFSAAEQMLSVAVL